MPLEFSHLQFRHPVDRFEVIETHISWVVLTGRFAYKIKKPVNLGFCDFTTLEKRRFYCEEELRLNCRLAPKMYLEIVPITGLPGTPVVEGPGPAIDYAVKMLEFPQDRLLSHLAEMGLLTEELVEDLARTLGAFHRTIPIAGAQMRFGTPETIGQAVQGALRHLDASPLQRWTEAEGRRLNSFFSDRKRDGFIREGHGDAHLGNMFEDRGRVVLFDAIEFNEDLRWIDMISEIAFTVMDLEHRGRSDLAALFLNSWLEGTGDYEGLKGLAYYKVYRALVRAKVAAIRLAQEGISENERRKARDEAGSYVALALKDTERARPRLSITHGLSGSGKTHETRRILMKEGGIRLRTDVERKRLFGLKAEEKSPETLKKEMYGIEANDRVYGRLADLSRLLLSEGYPVIVDGTFLKKAERRAFQELARDLRADFEILVFDASEDVLRGRILRRETQGEDASEAGLAVLKLQRSFLQPIQDDERPYVRAVLP